VAHYGVDIAKKIDQAEVDLGKREAQLAATAGRGVTGYVKLVG
jgi:hypothetical protein